MTKKQLVQVLSKKTGIELDIVNILVDAFSTEISTQLINGENVHVGALGYFGIKHVGPKVARLIKKKKQIIIPEHDTPYFHVANKLRLKIKNKSIQTHLPE